MTTIEAIEIVLRLARAERDNRPLRPVKIPNLPTRDMDQAIAIVEGWLEGIKAGVVTL